MPKTQRPLSLLSLCCSVMLVVVVSPCGAVPPTEDLEALAASQMVGSPHDSSGPASENDVVIQPTRAGKTTIPPYNPADPPTPMLQPVDRPAAPEDEPLENEEAVDDGEPRAE